MISTGKVRVLGLLALPLLVLAVAVMVFSWGHSSSSTAEAQGIDYTISIPAATCDAGKCEVNEGSDFTVVAALPALTGIVNGAYDGMAVTVGYSGGITSNGVLTMVWPDCVFGAPASGPGFENYGCAIGIGVPSSVYTGTMTTGSFNCPVGVSGQVELVSGTAADTLILDDKGTTLEEPAGSDVLNVNCVPGPTATPTPTPPPEPQMQKLPALQNDFLVRQGAKIPPLTCLTGDPISLTEEITFLPALIDPKDPSATIALGAFEFEVHFDWAKICVEIVPEDLSPDQVCLIEDATNSQLEGVARIGCVNLGKDNSLVEPTEESVVLATINVYPQPDVYSQAKPNQDNGVVVQLNNVGCELADLQGHPIPIFSCEDADITFRYLEGDVTADCEVTALDTQSIAFRWGAEKGSLIYADFMNLEPSGAQADDDIDIKDLQFVYGRFGSTCEEPWPEQPPVNPKG